MGVHRAPGLLKLDLDEDKLLPMFWQASRDPVNWTDKSGSAVTSVLILGPNVTLVTNATVLRINVTEPGATVKAVEFAAANGRRWSLPTSTVLVCAGAIENARILLSSDDVAAKGLGNENDLVGRFLMDQFLEPLSLDSKLNRPEQRRSYSGCSSRAPLMPISTT